MTSALGLLAATTLALAGAAMWPRAGHPVLLVVELGAEAAPLGVEGWRLQRLATAGPFGLLVLAPEGQDVDPLHLARAAGAWAVLAAVPASTCAISQRTR